MVLLARKWWTLIAVCTAIFMLLLDITVVNVALPDIQRSLHATFSDLQWVVDAYSLTLAAFMLTAGVIGDMFGRREVFAIGLGVFSLSSLVCGLSNSSLMLNLARGCQGVGGAVMFATSLALIAEAFQWRERGTAFGIYGAVIGGAVAVGPLIGGAITSAIGWRWIFFVNVPIGILAIAVTLTQIDESKDPNTRRIDWPGFATFSAALFLLVFGLVRGNENGWRSPLIVGLLVGAALLLGAFLVVELRRRDPMLDLSLFRRPAMVGVSAAAFAISASIFAMFLYLTLYIQDDLGFGPLAAGLRFLPITMLSFLVAPAAGRLTVKLPARVLLGCGLLAIGVGCVLMSFIRADSGWTILLPGFIVTGIGVGVVNPVLASSAIAVVPPQRSGMASGINNTFRQVGIATGIAGLGAVFQTEMQHRVTSALLGTAAGRAAARAHGIRLATAAISGQVRTAASHLPAAQSHAVLSAYASGFAATIDELMLIAAAIAFAGALVTAYFVRQRDFVPTGRPAHGGPGGPTGPGPGGGDGSGGSGGSRRPDAPPGGGAPVREDPSRAPAVA